MTGGEVCEIPGVGPVSVEWARSLLGDALLDLFISDGVDVRTVVRPRRKIPTPLLTAITERDQCCVVPGCGKRKGLEKDHWRRPVKDGGEASYENLVLLCSHHHSLRTHRGWVLTNENGRWRFDPPEQTTARGAPKRKGPKRKARSGAGPPDPTPGVGNRPAPVHRPGVRRVGHPGGHQSALPGLARAGPGVPPRTVRRPNAVQSRSAIKSTAQPSR